MPRGQAFALVTEHSVEHGLDKAIHERDPDRNARGDAFGSYPCDRALIPV